MAVGRVLAIFPDGLAWGTVDSGWLRQWRVWANGVAVVAVAVVAVAVTLWAPPPTHAQAQPRSGADSDADFGAEAAVDVDAPGVTESLSQTVVTREELEERMSRSAPEALRYVPGVYVQQTAHAQASPYVRGMTGQQVVHLFDGIRLNNGIYRQGPNQYFFTVDQYSLDRLEVLRGSASTRFGSDALGGAILAVPVNPDLQVSPADPCWHWGGRTRGTYASADNNRGGRLELQGGRGATAVLMGMGYRDVDRLRSGGVVRNGGRAEPFVPRFESDGKTQLGTGFEEATFDARVVHHWRDLQWVGAVYGYRQYDAPRTDQCPAPEAPVSECLTIDKQFRTLAYGSVRGDGGPGLRDLNMTLSYQNHLERRRRSRPLSFVENRWRNTVDTLGWSVRASTGNWVSPRTASNGSSAGRTLKNGTVRYGADVYTDRVGSKGEQSFTDLDAHFDLSRGQYLEGSRYLQSGVFAEVELQWDPRWVWHAGGRTSWVAARAPGDPESGTESVRRNWFAWVGRAGVSYRPTEHQSWFLNLDQGFRAPNLDDLTSRQQVGPGFQFENPHLQAEQTRTLELGWRQTGAMLEVEGWVFGTVLRDGITRALRTGSDCPVETPSCRSSRTQFQLVNAQGASVLWGGEAAVRLRPSDPWLIRSTVSYVWGEGPNVSTGDSGVTGGSGFFDSRTPLSRLPPLNGTLEVRWSHAASGAYAGGGIRWAMAQTRLAPSDLSDARIPDGGTPGYGVFDLRGGWQATEFLQLSAVFENLWDGAYRTHGSSVNGAGRGLWVSAEVAW